MPADEWRRLFEALLVLIAVRTALWLAPFGRIQQWVGRHARRPSGRKRFWRHERDRAVAESKQIIAAIERSACYVPRATCLTRALAAQFLLTRHGIRATLRLGVNLQQNSQLKAHAWLEANGQILLGGDVEGMDSFKPLPTAA
jgi:hypothetical protein